MRYIFIAIAIVILAGAAASFHYLKNAVSIERQSATTIISSLQKTRDVDKLYTGIYHIPVIDFEKGYLKRDMVKEGLRMGTGPLVLIDKGMKLFNNQPLMDENKLKVKGCCTKKYEVAFGYDHLMDILGNESLIGDICQGETSHLPDPQILAVNCKSTVSHGKYTSSGACYGWDSNDGERKRIIQQVMTEDGILPQVNSRAKEALKNLLLAFCDR